MNSTDRWADLYDAHRLGQVERMIDQMDPIEAKGKKHGKSRKQNDIGVDLQGLAEILEQLKDEHVIINIPIE